MKKADFRQFYRDAHAVECLSEREKIFLGLAVYQTKEVKEMAQEAAARGDERAASQIAITGAVGLYLVFLNLFMILLSILGIFSDD